MFASVAVAASLLNGCELTKSNNNVCTKMKREWLYNTNNPNREATWNTQAQKDAFRQKMKENNCI